MFESEYAQYNNTYTISTTDVGNPSGSEHDKTITIPAGFVVDLPYEDDGVTPNFDELFEALAEHERNAPPLIKN